MSHTVDTSRQNYNPLGGFTEEDYNCYWAGRCAAHIKLPKLEGKTTSSKIETVLEAIVMLKDLGVPYKLGNIIISMEYKLNAKDLIEVYREVIKRSLKRNKRHDPN